LTFLPPNKFSLSNEPTKAEHSEAAYKSAEENGWQMSPTDRAIYIGVRHSFEKPRNSRASDITPDQVICNLLGFMICKAKIGHGGVNAIEFGFYKMVFQPNPNLIHSGFIENKLPSLIITAIWRLLNFGERANRTLIALGV